ncbi:putative periplasmic binding protein-like I [Helianthus annuus]|nr:putative periplasmic binding protein-like I [Helianthus annuus]
MTPDETIQWKGLAAIAESFQWTNVILVHEDSEFGRESVPHIIDSFQDKKIHISYKSSISSLATDDQIIDELRKLSDMQERVFVIHVSHFLAFRILVYAKRVGLMSQGYAWIVTDKTMNFFDPIELDEEVLESFQGVLGLKYHIPSSIQLRNFSRRWRKESLLSSPNIFNILAYDTTFVVATAIERAEIRPSKDGKKVGAMMAMDFTNIRESESGKILLKELLNVRFKGLSGEFHLVNSKFNAKPLEIVNVIGKGERRVGIWTEDDGVNGLEGIIWPGGSLIPPRRLILQTSKKLRIGVPMLVGFEDFLTVEQNPLTNETIAKGFCVDVFNAAIEALSYEVPYVFVPFSVANKKPNSETYNQLIYEVYLQNFDAVVGDTTITANRSLYVDFTIPYTDLGVGTVTRDDQNLRKIWWFLEPLDARMWIAATCSFFIIGATIWVIEYPINPTFQGPWQDVVGPVLWFSFSTLTFSHSNLSLLYLSIHTHTHTHIYMELMDLIRT